MKLLSLTSGVASPVTLTPSRLHSLKVQLATTGLPDSIQAPVPRSVRLVIVTPFSSVSLARTRVTF